MSSNWHKLPER
jgi:outer membrane biosynthesis protein TonB